LPYALKTEGAVHIYQTTRHLIPEDCDRNIHRIHRDLSEYRIREGGIGGACSTHYNDEKCLENVCCKTERKKPVERARNRREGNVKADRNHIECG
jgi:hypothetical protein